MIESDPGLKYRLQELFNNLRQGSLRLARLTARKVHARDVQVDDTILVDTIDENTPAAGVTIDTVPIKDGAVDGVDVSAHDVAATGVHGAGGATIAYSGGAFHDGFSDFVALEHLPVTDATSDPLVDGEAAADGTEATVARKDHVHPKHHAESHDYDTHSGGVPYAELEYDDATSDPLIDGAAAADGTEDSAARKDHVHPLHHAESHDYDTHSGGVPYAELEYDDATSDPLVDGAAAADGTENSVARKDHVHPRHHTPAARVYNSANISIPDITLTALTFNSERWDTDSMHSVAANTSRLTATTAGLYVISALIAVASAVYTDLLLLIRLNGTTDIARVRTRADSALPHELEVSTQYYLAATDYVEVGVYQNTGAAKNVVALGNYSPEFMMAWVRPTP